MTAFTGIARSNGFRVKDPETFKTWANGLGLEVAATDDPAGDQFALFTSKTDGGSFPTYRYNKESDEETMIDMVAELSSHLQTGEFAVIMGIASLGRSYLTGVADVITWDGRSRSLTLSDIYRVAVNELGADPMKLTKVMDDGSSSYESNKAPLDERVSGEAIMACMAIRNTKAAPVEGQGR